MMEFLAGFGIGLCVGIVGTVASFIWMRDQGYQITRTDKLTGREAEQLTEKVGNLEESLKSHGDRLDAVNDVLEEQSMRIKEHDSIVHKDHERVDRLVDIMTLDKEEDE